MAVKFSQFLAESLTSPSFLVGYNSSTNQNVKVSYADLLAALGGGGISGSGTTNYVSKWTGATALGNSQIFDNGTNVGINTATPIVNNNITINQGASNKGIVITGSGTVFGNDTTGGSRIYAYANIVNNRQLVLGRTDDGLGTNVQVTGRSSAAIFGQNSATGAIIDTELGGYVGANLNLVVKGTTGNVLIGTTGTDAGFKLDVSGTFRSSGDATINGVTAGRGNGNVSTNTSFGVLTFQGFNPTGNENSAFGFQAINLLTTGQRNTGIGLQALLSTSTGNRNTGLGYRAGLYISSGSDNTIIGNNNAINLTTGVHNTVLGSNTGHGIVTGSYNVVIGGNVTGLSSSLSNTIILADGQGNIRQYIDSTGNVGIGTTSPTNGMLQVTTTSTGDVVYFNRGSNYIKFGGLASGTGSYIAAFEGEFQIRNNFNGHITFWNNNTEKARIAITTGNFLINTTTDAGQKLQVNGSIRFDNIGILSNVAGSAMLSANNTDPLHANLRTNGANISLTTSATGEGVIGYYSNIATLKWYQDTIGYKTYEPNTAFTIAPTSDSYRSLVIRNNGATATANLIEFREGASTVMGGMDNKGDLFLGTSSPNASAILHLSSTTKGFLPPVMTGTQAEAIASPAVGLMVFSTDGSGTTINSSGWWGYTSAGWVKIG